ncbi:helix-turn-helix domain-containing protein [Neobacillus sp. LXY-1]|uniref:helix-turn-helix domain-containing protein n=1 Tax=Neobacillus sp. LXY-1 TaxID=3379133 RepID=UPI003EDF1F0B
MDSDKTDYIGYTIKKLRKALGITQEELAFRSNLNRVFIGELERNEKAASIETFFKLAEGFGIEPEDLAKEMKEFRRANKG